MIDPHLDAIPIEIAIRMTSDAIDKQRRYMGEVLLKDFLASRNAVPLQYQEPFKSLTALVTGDLDRMAYDLRNTENELKELLAKRARGVRMIPVEIPIHRTTRRI